MSIVKEMFFTEGNETNIKRLQSLFLCLRQMKLSLINCFDYTMKAGTQIPHKDQDQRKDQNLKSASNIG